MTAAHGLTPAYFRVGWTWGGEERMAALRCRWGRLGKASLVPAGLYALGRPGSASPVVLTGNYRLTFDRVRCDLAGNDCWILAADTHGLDVGSAAAAGLLGTAEIVQTIDASRIGELVDHRDCVIPWHAGVTAQPEQALKASGFRLIVGPRRSRDLAAFLGTGMSLIPAMQEASFTFMDRLALAPAELSRSLKLFPGFAFAALIYAGLGAGGVSLGKSMAEGWQLLVLGFTSIVCGSLIAPVLPPSAPHLPYVLRGWALGAAATTALLFGAGIFRGETGYLAAACCAFFPAAAGFLGMRFRAASPLPAEQGIAREKKTFLPLAVVAGVIAAVALVLAKITQWGS
jgi:hypothetical protein